MRLCTARKKWDAAKTGAPINGTFVMLMAAKQKEVIDAMYMELQQTVGMKRQRYAALES